MEKTLEAAPEAPVICDACRLHRLRPTKPDPEPGRAVKRITFAGVSQNVCQRHFRYFDKFMHERLQLFSWSDLKQEQAHE